MDIQFLNTMFNGLSGKVEFREILGKNEIKKTKFVNITDLENYKPTKDRNIYFGLFTRKPKAKSGNALNCLETRALWLDFDNAENKNEIKERLKKADLPDYSFLIHSGNGYHCYWLLDEPTKEVEHILNKMILLTGADPKAKDKARILRVPGTFNVKEINDPKECRILEGKKLKYPIKQFENLLNVTTNDLKPVTKDYVNLATETIKRECIKNILKGAKEKAFTLNGRDFGTRHFALGRLTRYLKEQGYPRAKTYQIIKDWNSRNQPELAPNDLNDSFKYYWQKDYKLLGCIIPDQENSERLAQFSACGQCEFKRFNSKQNLEDAEPYNNRLLKDLSKLSGNELIVYHILRIYEEQTIKELRERLKTKATNKPCMDTRTLRKSITFLVSEGYISENTIKARNGVQRIYKIKNIGTYGLGYTIITNGAVYGVIDKRITPRLFKLFVLIKKHLRGGKGYCYPSAYTLAKELRTNSNNISRDTKKLEESGYIRKIRTINEKGGQKVFYECLL